MNIRRGTIFLDRVERGSANWTNAFFAPFAENAHRFGVKIDISDAESGQLAQAQTARIKKLHDRDVAQGHP